MGIPLITNCGVGDVEEIVLKYNAGILIDKFTDEAFTAAADKVVAGHNYDAMGIRQGAKDFYALDSAIEKYNRIYNAIFNQ